MTIIPYDSKTHVKRLRRYIGDTADLNKLIEAEECTDEFLYEALQDTFDKINYAYLPTTSYTVEDLGTANANDFKSWVTVKRGAILEILIGKGILSARNTLTYNDASNITVQDTDTYGRYINFFNLLINKFHHSVTMIKRSKNIDDCYGGVDSAFSYDFFN